MSFFDLFIHSGFGDGSGPAGRITIQWMLYYTIVAHFIV